MRRSSSSSSSSSSSYSSSSSSSYSSSKEIKEEKWRRRNGGGEKEQEVRRRRFEKWLRAHVHLQPDAIDRDLPFDHRAHHLVDLTASPEVIRATRADDSPCGVLERAAAFPEVIRAI